MLTTRLATIVEKPFSRIWDHHGDRVIWRSDVWMVGKLGENYRRHMVLEQMQKAEIMGKTHRKVDSPAGFYGVRNIRITTDLIKL